MSDENERGPDLPTSLEQRTSVGGRRFSPSVGRNKEVVAAAFEALMPADGHVLEIGSGTGEHGIVLMSQLPSLRWTFSDPDDDARDSITAWITETGLDRANGPFDLDVSSPNWWQPFKGKDVTGLFSANVIHIAPFAVAKGLFAGAGAVLPPGGRLFFYGPFGRNGEMADGNQRFDTDLKRRSANWGVRDLDRDLVPVAHAAGLSLADVREMPKNNLSVVFERSAKGP
ncbi:MAG: DUF938 domain-containing protein [Pseudomonadota bacterium]